MVLALVIASTSPARSFVRASAAQAALIQVLAVATHVAVNMVVTVGSALRVFDGLGPWAHTLLPTLVGLGFVLLPFGVLNLIGAIRACQLRPFRFPLLGRIVERMAPFPSAG